MTLATLAFLLAAAQPAAADGFEQPDRWTASASDGVVSRVSGVPGDSGQALRLDYDFASVSGYAFAARTLLIDWPENYVLRLKLRGRGGVNDLQLKFTNASGDNVWWVQKLNFRPSQDWQELRIRPRDMAFAWGPTQDKSLRRTARMEIVLVRGRDGWHERLVACQDTLFLPIAGARVPDTILPPDLAAAAPGAIIETSPASVAVMADLSARIVAQGGTALVIDYGYDGPAVGETLQAVRGHAFANPFEAPGEQDLTAHVDMATLGLVATASGANLAGPVGQGAFLTALGIAQRAAALGPAVAADHARLVGDMGTLFRVIAATHPQWPQPAGFA